MRRSVFSTYKNVKHKGTKDAEIRLLGKRSRLNVRQFVLHGLELFAHIRTASVHLSALPAAQTHGKALGQEMKEVVAALIVSGDKVLICQRTKHQPMPLKWEFPGGKIEVGEQPNEALRRELDEELGIDAAIGDQVAHLIHRYGNGGAIDLRFFVVREFQRELENRIFHEIRWANRTDLPCYDFLDADRRLVREIAAGGIY